MAAFALAPLLFEAEAPGYRDLHPVAVVIFSGLISTCSMPSSPRRYSSPRREAAGTPARTHQGDTSDSTSKRSSNETDPVDPAHRGRPAAPLTAIAHEEHGKSQYRRRRRRRRPLPGRASRKPDRLTLFITEHGKPPQTAGGSAKPTLLAGSQKILDGSGLAGCRRQPLQRRQISTSRVPRWSPPFRCPASPAKTLRFSLDKSHEGKH